VAESGLRGSPATVGHVRRRGHLCHGPAFTCGRGQPIIRIEGGGVMKKRILVVTAGLSVLPAGGHRAWAP
jgi:hypothetical protein